MIERHNRLPITFTDNPYWALLFDLHTFPDYFLLGALVAFCFSPTFFFRKTACIRPRLEKADPYVRTPTLLLRGFGMW